MALFFSEKELDVMQRLKAVFNPDNLANPSKIFPMRRGCGEMPKNLLESAIRSPNKWMKWFGFEH